MAITNIGFFFVFVFSFCCGSLFSAVLPNLFRSFQIQKVIAIFCAFNFALFMHVIVILMALKTPIGYGRVFVFVEFLWLINLLFIGLVVGSRFKYFNVSKSSVVVVCYLFIMLMLYKNVNLLADAKLFAKQHDERIIFFEKLKILRNRSNIYVPSLKGKDVFGYEDIQQEDTVTHIIPYPNHSIHQYYQLPFKVFLDK